MTNLKTTKRALLSSVVALLVCFTMLLGTTFAWFTDSVTSSNNIIQTGTLDVSLEHADTVLGVDDEGWVDASTGAIFNYSNWEPGYTTVKYVKIENEGTLDLKFMLNIIPNNEAEEVNLADVIEVYMVSGAVAVERDALTTDSDAYVGTLTSLMNENDGAAHGVLYADDADKAGNVYEIYTIALKMSTSAGNEYMGKSVGGGFSVQLLATQLASEGDSFDNQYDADATYPGEVRTAEDLSNALSNGESVKLVEDIVMDHPLTFDAADDLEIDLAGNRLEVEYVTITGGSDVVINDSTGTGAEIVIDTTNFIIEENSTVTLKGVDIVTNNTGIAIDSGSTLNMYEGTITVSGSNGGIYLSNLDGIEATFNMYGGEIIIESGYGITVDARYDSAMNVNLYGGRIIIANSAIGVCVNNGAVNLMIGENFIFEKQGEYSFEYMAMNGNVNVTDNRQSN